MMFGSYQTVGHAILVSCKVLHKVLQMKHVEVMYRSISYSVC